MKIPSFIALLFQAIDELRKLVANAYKLDASGWNCMGAEQLDYDNLPVGGGIHVTRSMVRRVQTIAALVRRFESEHFKAIFLDAFIVKNCFANFNFFSVYSKFRRLCKYNKFWLLKINGTNKSENPSGGTSAGRAAPQHSSKSGEEVEEAACHHLQRY
jgi:hypothetical protein